jgi:hypothetical protein
MGMFDIVTVEYPLPDAGAAEVREWQTKGFPDPLLEHYKITANGRLLHERIHYEVQSDPQYPIGNSEHRAGSMTRIHEGWDDVHFHGILNFYGDKYSGELRLISPAPETFGKDLLHSEPAEWFEYNAEFTDGQLVSIERVLTARNLTFNSTCTEL